MYRIGIDYTPAYEQGAGIGRLVRELVGALSRLDDVNEYRLFVSGWREGLPPLAPNFVWRGTRISPEWLARLWHRAYLPLPVEIFMGRVDLYHATDFVLPPTLPHTKTIITVHDLSFVYVPETASPRLRAYLERVVPRSIHRATHIIADSVATKRDIMAHYGTEEAKISVVLSGVDNRFGRVTDGSARLRMREKYGIDERPYFFCIGTVQPRKNYARIIEALGRLIDAGQAVQLVIAGGRGWLEDDMYQTIDKLDLTDSVRLIGYADDADLPALYSDAIGLVFASLYEGFGFPILESMACGTAVITSDISSLPEVAGDATLLVNPESVDAIYGAMLTLLRDNETREKLISAGYERVKAFRWEDSAVKLQQIYLAILEGRTP